MSMVKFIDITRANFDSLTTKADTSLFFVKETNNTYSLYKGSLLVSGNITLPAHSHKWSEITEKPTIPTDFTNWTQVWSGSTNLNSYRSSFYTAEVPSNSYTGKRIAIEVQYSSGTTHTSKIIFGVLGSSSATYSSTTISRGIGWNYFDGTNLRVKTLYAYTPTGTSTSINVGNLKTLFGTFTGTTIEWSTSHSETLYMKNIWVIE